MKLIKLTALSSLLFVSVMSLISCESDEELRKVTEFTKTGIPFTGDQVVPKSPAPGTGSTLDVSYSKVTRTLNYKLTWTGLSDSVIAIRVSAVAPVGYSAATTAFATWATLPTFKPFADTTTPYTYKQQFTNGTFTSATLGTNVAKGLYGPAGTFSSSLAVDGVVIKEEDILNGFYYVTIHTKTFTTAPVSAAVIPDACQLRWYGEVRAQVKLR